MFVEYQREIPCVHLLIRLVNHVPPQYGVSFLFYKLRINDLHLRYSKYKKIVNNLWIMHGC